MLKYHEIQTVRKSCSMDEQTEGKRKTDRTLDQDKLNVFCQRGIICIQNLWWLGVGRSDFRNTLMALMNPLSGG